MKLIFLDTETTGKDPEDRLIQLAFKQYGDRKSYNAFFKAPVPIKYEAMATHHITNEVIADCPVFAGSVAKDALEEMLKTHILVAHNAKFDVGMLEKEGVKIPQYICTLKVAQRLFDFSMYKLQFLRYRLGLEIGEVRAHDADGDVEVLEALFTYLVHYMQREDHEITDQQILDKMLTWSSQPVMLRRMPFGKHEGQPFDKVPRDYLHWVLDKASPDEDLKYTINHWLNPQLQISQK